MTNRIMYTKKFNGISFRFIRYFPSKHSAQLKAKEYRDKGYNARTVKEKGKYAVYRN